jgi:sugar lactone lactonase YvrE
MKNEKKTKDTEARLVLDAKATLGEGALWHPAEKRLYWVDI